MKANSVNSSYDNRDSSGRHARNHGGRRNHKDTDVVSSKLVSQRLTDSIAKMSQSILEDMSRQYWEAVWEQRMKETRRFIDLVGK